MVFDIGMEITYDLCMSATRAHYLAERVCHNAPRRDLALYPKLRTTVAGILASFCLIAPAQAQGIPPIFGDTEVEQTIRTFCTPIWIAAGLKPEDVHVVLVNSPDLQAFVAGGQNIFIFTGLLEKSDDPLQIAGVVAHETGHIAGGHLARGDEDMENASYTMLLATVLGAAAAAGSRDPGAIAGALGIGEDMGIRSYLAFSRTKEASADEAGMNFMEKAQLSPRGLLEFMKKIQVEEGVPLRGDQKFLVDHPPTPDRVEAMIQGVRRSRYADKQVPPEWNELYARMKAKLIGYLHPDFAMRKYSRADASIAGRYGRSVALWRLGQIEPAVELIDQLIALEPKNPYFYQAKAQMLFENGRVADSIAPFKQAAALAPKDTGEIHMEYAQALLEKDDPANLVTAIDELKIAEKADTHSADLHRFFAIAYGRQGYEAIAKVELAEQAILEGKPKTARRMAQDAMRRLPAGSREWLRAQDLIAASLIKEKHGGGDSEGVHFSVGPAGDSPNGIFGQGHSGFAPQL
ncbi:MAG: peptidase [Rhodospirillales bacterium]|nr:peptidase [Rhodospirillales bacterium]